MECRLVELDKQPGVHTLGMGNTLHHLMAKCVLCTVGDHATQQCGNFNLYIGLMAGIEGAVNVICKAEGEVEAAAAAAATTTHSQEHTSAESSAYDGQEVA